MALAGSADCVKTTATKEIPFSLPSVEPLAAARPAGDQSENLLHRVPGEHLWYRGAGGQSRSRRSPTSRARPSASSRWARRSAGREGSDCDGRDEPGYRRQHRGGGRGRTDRGDAQEQAGGRAQPVRHAVRDGRERRRQAAPARHAKRSTAIPPTAFSRWRRRSARARRMRSGSREAMPRARSSPSTTPRLLSASSRRSFQSSSPPEKTKRRRSGTTPRCYRHASQTGSSRRPG